MLKTVEYINQYGLEKLISTYNLVANWSKRYPNLVQLCYHQLETPKNEITNECRGLILDTTDNFKLISYPFYRFSDYDERSDKVLDLESLKFYEKLDGSIISLYYYNGEWNISTKTIPDADGRIHIKDVIFRDFFFEVFNKLGYKLPNDINNVYVFEFMFEGQGITLKNKESISLLMVRNLITYEELNHEEIGNNLGYVNANHIKGTSLDEIKKIVRNLDPLQCEGYVVCDKNYTRFKIKSPQYERISELKVNWDNTEDRQRKIEIDNFRKLCDIIRTNNIDTFIKLEIYASVYNQFKKIKGLYKKLLNDTQHFVDKIDGLQGKELGLLTKGYDKYLNTLAFGITQGKIDKSQENYLEDFFYEMNIKTFEEIIKKIK